jgi:hypothetical protein
VGGVTDITGGAGGCGTSVVGDVFFRPPGAGKSGTVEAGAITGFPLAFQVPPEGLAGAVVCGERRLPFGYGMAGAPMGLA